LAQMCTRYDKKILAYYFLGHGFITLQYEPGAEHVSRQYHHLSVLAREKHAVAQYEAIYCV